MKSVVLILPYFGKFPDIFPLFLKTAEKNPNINFLIISDSEENINYPKNVRILSQTFSEFKKLMEKQLGQTIALEKPYKLCDYKPIYGYVLSEQIKQYDYWGYCDCDLIWGDLYSFIEPLMEKGYDKIFASGHLTLYRNTQENNELFRTLDEGALFSEISKDNQIYWFDEDYQGKNNIHDLFLKSGKKVFAEDFSVNFNINTNCFQRKMYSPENRTYIDIPYEKEQYYWDAGKIYQVKKREESIAITEYPYIHFQLRYMHGIQCALSEERFKIVPNRFLKCDKIPRTLEDWKYERKVYFGGQRFIQLRRRIIKKIKKVFRKC
nr:DUF6625 family protein [uncultured Mediterraneibacter sp.]